jgi:hypothetical protein
MRKRQRAGVLGLALALASCSSPLDNPPTPPPLVRPRDAAPVPSFARDIAPVLARHCTAKDCHGEQPTIDITMDLRPSLAYRQLVNVPAEMGEAHLMRVKPGDPENSLIVHKLTGRIGRKEGKAMPIDGDTGAPVRPSPLPASFVDGVLVPWILAGAPDN